MIEPEFNLLRGAAAGYVESGARGGSVSHVHSIGLLSESDVTDG